MVRRGAARYRWAPLGVAIVALTLVVACGPSASTGGAGVADCATSVPARTQAAFALGISWRGHVCWEVSVTGAPRADLFHSSSPPAYDSGTVLLSSNGQVVALTPLDGRRVWSTGPTDGGDDSVGADHGDYLVDAEAGVAVTGQSGSWVGAAVRDGRRLWSQPPPSGAYDEGPVPSGQGGLVLAYNTGQVAGLLDLRTGRVVWHDPQTPSEAPTGGGVEIGGVWPVVAGGVIVASKLDHNVDGVSLATGRTLWTLPASVWQATAAGNVVVLAPDTSESRSGVGEATAIDAATGHRVWSSPPYEPGPGRYAEMGGALIYTDGGTPSPAGSGPGATGEFARIDPATGRKLWDVTTTPYLVVATGNEIVSLDTAGADSFSADTRYTLVGRDANTGRTLWSTPNASEYAATNQLLTIPSPDGPVVIVLDHLHLSGFSGRTGRKLWTISVPRNDLVDGVTAAGSGVVIQAYDSQYQLQGH
jgi:hypothetical protein